MLEKLRALADRYDHLEKEILDPSVITRSEYYTKCLKELGENRRIVTLFKEYQQTQKQIEESQELLKEPEMKDLAQEELQLLKKKLEALREEIQELLLMEDENTAKNVIVEIRAGVGGAEASLFVADLFRMYSKYIESKRWVLELLSSSESEVGGYKEMTFLVKGDHAFKYFQFEGGGHRVQRVPTTEAQGRIHTSSCTVAILPEAEEIEFELKDSELHIEAFRSSGPGGQNVNKTSSAIRVVHLPTGVTVACQEESSQLKNKLKALKLLRSRILASIKEKADQERGALRRNQVGSGDRSERIRTYNFPQNRLTDHRIKESYSLETAINGDLEKMIQDLLVAEKARKLAEANFDL